VYRFHTAPDPHSLQVYSPKRMTPKTAVHATAHATPPLVQSVVRAAMAVLDPALTPTAVLQVVTDHARELIGATQATVSLTVEGDVPAHTEGRVLQHTVTDDTGRAVGTICLSGKPGGFTPEDTAILQALTPLASMAIHNARVRDTLRLSEERMRAALDSGRDQIRHAALDAEVSLVLTSTEPMTNLLQQSAEAIARHVNAASVRIWTMEPGGRALDLHAAAGASLNDDGAYYRVPIGHLEIGTIAQERRAHLVNEVIGDPHVADQEWAKREGIVSFAGFPLVVSDQLVGVLALFAKRPIADEEFEGLAGVARTVGLGIERKQVEAGRDRALTEAAAERKRLEHSIRELDEFAYTASHDLKAPLRGIANLAGWIEDDLRDSMREETRDMLSMLRGRMHRLEALIEGMLQFSRAGRPRGQPELVNVGTLVGEVIELLAPPASTTVVVKPGMPTMITDRFGLHQVFLNLIGNAVKFSHAADSRIEIDVDDGGGAFYEFFVIDNGPGIPIEFQHRIWAIFQTLAPRDEIEGTGIGLALVKKTVESRGGRVRVESAPGHGSTFSFLWPKQMAHEGA
jgi:signal transduction histidine kinase